MAFDESLAQRTREVLVELIGPGAVGERKMFGGLAFMVNTHMACGLIGDDLMIRVGPHEHDHAVARGAQEMDFTGRPMRGMVVVPGPAVADEDTLRGWVTQAVAYATSQPPKPAKRPRQAK